ncbi:MAG: NUDIX domain-containing protein [Candidatus Buchananbacteria bacterium]|nr:NUDIX domain-containing protein [Candidatus Buchananbacteria bacterium]
MTPKIFVATKAFIVHQGKVLIVRESTNYGEGTNAGKYDVVGGRVKPGENWSDSLKREVKEETGLDIQIGKPFYVGEWRPVVNNEPWQVVGIFFECHATTDQVQLSQDHDDHQWIEPANFKEYDLIPNLNEAFEAYL